MPSPTRRVLVAIPAHNEQGTIQQVIEKVRGCLPDFDLLVVNDGSRDKTEGILRSLNVTTATHLCNLGYGRAIQTAIKYASKFGYDTVITLDADGQHQPEQIRDVYNDTVASGCDLMIGSRYMKTRQYLGTALGRRIGMRFFSLLVKCATGQRIYDTTSGLKIIQKTVFEPCSYWQFIDYHAEAIVYLLRLGYRIAESPITVAERREGQSMYSFISHFTYPVKTSLLVVIGIVEAALTRHRQSLGAL